MSKESGTTTYVRYQCPVTLTHGPLTESGWQPLAVLLEPMQHGVKDSPIIISKMHDVEEGDLLGTFLILGTAIVTIARRLAVVKLLS